MRPPSPRDGLGTFGVEKQDGGLLQRPGGEFAMTAVFPFFILKPPPNLQAQAPIVEKKASEPIITVRLANPETCSFLGKKTWLMAGIVITLPESNIAHEIGWFEDDFLLGMPIFRCYVSFREGTAIL